MNNINTSIFFILFLCIVFKATSANCQELKPCVVLSKDTSFVVAWEDDSDGNGFFQIHAAGYDKDGTKSFDEISVNSESSGQQFKPDISMLPNGYFVVVWQDDKDLNGVYQIKAAGFNPNGTKLFGDITVNTDSPGQQIRPSVDIASDSSFVVVWEDDTDANGSYQILGAGFDAEGNKQFGDITINSESAGQQRKPRIALNTHDFFVVTWEDDSNDNGYYQILAAGFDTEGVKQFGDIVVNSEGSGQQLKPTIALAPDSTFVVAWEDDNNKNGYFEILAAGFDAEGNKLFGDITVNEEPSGQQLKPDVDMASNGIFVIAWEDDYDDNGIFQVFMSLFNADGTKLLEGFPVPILDSSGPSIFGYQLMQNYPNPFNPVTTINYQLPQVSKVDLSIYNLLGQKVYTLLNKKQPIGNYTMEWDASSFSSGIYFYRLETDKGFVQSRKLILLK